MPFFWTGGSSGGVGSRCRKTMTPPRRRLVPFCRRLAATAAAGLLAASFGLAMGWSTVANWQLQLAGEQLQLEPAQRAGLHSVLFAGIAAGCLLGGWLGGRLGPRTALLASVPVILASSGLTFFSTSFGALITGEAAT